MIHRRARNVSENSVRTYRSYLEHWLSWRSCRALADDLAVVTAEELRRFFVYLRDEHIPHAGNGHRPGVQRRGMKPATIAGYYRVIGGLWRFALAENLLTDQQGLFFTRGRIPRPRVPEERRPACDRPTLDALLTGCSGSDEFDTRNRAILLLLYESGLRVSELCNMQDANVELGKRRAWIVGKGQRGRWIFWHADAGEALSQYVAIRRGRPGGACIRGVSSRNDGGAMTPTAVRAMLKRLGVTVGVQLPLGSPCHWFRHGFAHAALEAGLDVTQVAQLLGHSDVQTTMRYVRENPGRLQELHARMRL